MKRYVILLDILLFLSMFATKYLDFHWITVYGTNEKVGVGCYAKCEPWEFSPFSASISYFTNNAFNIHFCYRKYFDYTLNIGSNGCTSDKTTSWYVTDWFSIETYIPLEDEEWDRLLERK